MPDKDLLLGIFEPIFGHFCRVEMYHDLGCQSNPTPVQPGGVLQLAATVTSSQAVAAITLWASWLTSTIRRFGANYSRTWIPLRAAPLPRLTTCPFRHPHPPGATSLSLACGARTGYGIRELLHHLAQALRGLMHLLCIYYDGAEF